MNEKSYKLYVSFCQFAIFASHLDQPFNDWNDHQISQGFAWRRNSVSFRTLVEDGVHLIKVALKDEMPPVAEDAIRTIEVPFESPSDGNIELASISDSVAVSLPSGKYMLRCEFFGQISGDENIIRVTFVSAA
ncbi:MAG TPA: competence protein ComJ [Rhodanobacter sp.]|jgi:hypothetical protein|nr:competence protein ComJ [Rhodanobacter sp.]HWX66064.1 competence protein ComJ [Rhodanobacter sp.]